MKRLLLFICLFVTTTGLFSQAPVNDVCSGAISLGTLGAPGACGTSTATIAGSVKTLATTNVNSTPENPYTTLSGCLSGTLAAPANDVWYSFVVPTNGFGVTIQITGGGAALSTPNITLWSGSCGSLAGVACIVGSGGAATLTVPSGMVVGQTYYLQISGGTGQSGTFTLKANVFQDCGDCSNAAHITVSPAPVNGTYQPGQKVSFCFHVDQWTQTSNNWLHGVQLAFGNGWNTASLVTTSPADYLSTAANSGCGSNCGSWAYYPSGIHATQGTTPSANVAYAAGFYFDGTYNTNCTCGSTDGNPGNNFGDGTSNPTHGPAIVVTPSATEWNFCWTIQVATGCNPGASLSVKVTTSGDGESGAWSSTGCLNDSPTNFSAVQACCPPTINVTNILCNGQSTGSATATAVVGSAGNQDPYVFNWTGGATATNTITTGTSNNLPNLPAGNYTVTVTDKNLCAASTTVAITQPTVISATVTPVNATCLVKGSITTTASGGTAPYTYAWSGPNSYTSTTQSPTALVPGTYSLTITDHNNCTHTTTATVAQTGSITVTATSPTVCANGAATITAGGATTYSWTAGVTTSTGTVVTASSVTATTSYTVTGTTGTCTNTAVSTLSVIANPTLTVTSPTVCTGKTATVTATGNATTYSWTAGVAPTTGTVVTVSPGTTTSYTVTGTKSTCTNTAVSTVSVIANPTLTVTNPTICAGKTATITATGNATTYSWTAGVAPTTGTVVTVSPGATTSYTVTGAVGTCTNTAVSTVSVIANPTLTVTSPTICAGTTATITSTGNATTYSWTAGVSPTTGTTVTVSPGATISYTVTGTTGTCTNTAVSTVSVTPKPTIIVNNASICSGGTATLTANGASSYTWSTSATTNSISVSPVSTTSYTVSGTANSCTNTATATVSVVSSLTATINSPTICAGTTALLTADGAATYTWSTGATTNTISVSPATTSSYSVTGSAGTCSATASSTVTIVSNPTVTVTSPTVCANATATITASGAATYSWTTGVTNPTGTIVTVNPGTTTSSYTVVGTTGICSDTVISTVTIIPNPTVTVNSPTICATNTVTLTGSGASTYSWSTGETTNSISVSPASTISYTVTGTTNACTDTAVSTVSVISNPTITVNSTAICIGQQTATLTANSNASSFSWSPATGLSSTIDAIVTATPSSIQTYTIIGSAGTCTVSTIATVTVNLLPTISATSSTICLGQQTATLTASGAGTGTYSWNPPTGLSATSGSLVTGTPTSTQAYTVTGMDINGCVNTGTDSITVSPIPTVTVNNPSICATNTVTLTAGGASTYSWSTNETTPSISVSPASTSSYTVMGTTNSCTNTAISTISVISNPTITVNSAAICLGQQTATLTANSNASSFSWSPATGLSTSTDAIVMATPSSTQTYTITGSAGTCTVSTTATVTVNPLPVPTATANVPCETEQALNLTSLPNGMNSYVWSGPNTYTANTQNTSIPLGNVTQALAGTYTILVTDNNSCTNTASIVVTIHPKPIVTATGATVCVGQTFTLTSGGAGTPPNAGYNWTGPSAYNSAQENPVITNATMAMTGAYNVVGTDINGCYSGLSIQVTVNSLPVITVNSGTTCVGQTTASLTASSTNAGTTYSWNPSAGLSAATGSNVIANPSPTGNYAYVVTGTDGSGCVGTNTATVLVNALPTITATSTVICAGQQTATLTASGGVTYIWSPATGLNSLTGNTVTGTPSLTQSYIVTSTDGNNCYNTATATITVNSIPVLTVNSGTICVGQATASLTASSSNAGTNYTWVPSTGLNTSVGANVLANPSPANNYTYVITGIDANNCVGTFTTNVLVYPLPSLSIVETATAICLGQQTATITASGATTYTWSPPIGLSTTKGNIVKANPVKSQNYSVTATDIHNCVNTATTNITVNQLPVVTISPVPSECIPFCMPVTASCSPSVTSYTWNFNNGQPISTATLTPSSILTTSACYAVSGTYPIKLTVADINTCANSGTGSVLAFSQPTADFDYGPQPVSILAPEVQFTNESSAGLTHYSWNFGDIYKPDTSSLINPSYNYSDVGTYYVTLIVSTNKGCSASVVKPIIINDDYAIYVPNAFTPNQDGKNELFLAVGEGIKTFKMWIFDRWGLLIFYSEDITKGWDGTIQGKEGNIVQQDVYVWKIELTNIKNKSKELSGTVTLLK